jgi:hypothetical protein
LLLRSQSRTRDRAQVGSGLSGIGPKWDRA